MNKRYINAFLEELSVWLNTIFSSIPGKMGIYIRGKYLRGRFKKCGYAPAFAMNLDLEGLKYVEVGNRITVSSYCSIYAHNNGTIKIGNNFSMNRNSCLGASEGGEILIGNDVLIAQNVVIRASNHEFKSIDIPINQQGHRGGKIIIEDNCWIAANVVITSNITIGAHSIVAAGAVVTSNVEPFSIVGGVPARLIKKRN